MGGVSLDRNEPAWEVIRHYDLNNLQSAGVGLESSERPGKTGLRRKRPLNGVQLEGNGARARCAAEVSHVNQVRIESEGPTEVHLRLRPDWSMRRPGC